MCAPERVREKKRERERKRARAGEMAHLHRHLRPPPHLWHRYGQVPEWVKHGGAEAADCARHGAFQLSHKQVWRRKQQSDGQTWHHTCTQSCDTVRQHTQFTYLRLCCPPCPSTCSTSAWLFRRPCEWQRENVNMWGLVFFLSIGEINMTRNDNMVVALKGPLSSYCRSSQAFHPNATIMLQLQYHEL